MTEDFSDGSQKNFAFNISAEQHLLGTLLIEQAAIESAKAIVSDRDFYREEHRCVFAAMLALSEKGDLVDFLSVQDELKRGGQEKKVGSPQFLVSLLDAVPAAEDAATYAQIVHLCALWRRQHSSAS